MSETVPLPLGFSAAGASCGVKDPSSPKKDIALFVSDRACAAAGVFTTNLVCGAPVKVSRERLPRATARGVVINSGNANACTGEQGLADALTMAAAVAQKIGCDPTDVLVASTGVIGRFLPLDRIKVGIDRAVKELGAQPQALMEAATAMMTTDTVPKLATRVVSLKGKSARITGVCKGAAMIAPNMATMLCAIMTDAELLPEKCAASLTAAVTDSFNCISVDGHESTSDSVILLANGASGVGPYEADEWLAFQAALNEVAQDLSMQIIRDAEGAHHFVQLDVTGCRTREEADRIATAVANSALVKTAICGADPNWGRIVSAAGYAGVPLAEADISLVMNGFPLYTAGTPLEFDAAAVSKSLRDNRDVTIELKLTHGEAAVRFWTSDLTKEYVELNADYTT
ncbi:MAG TPA: bifunctional glutamate N-acetyltransferase/amino-acid acetyltransferase ArgJ [Planctomycetaceae bacterium]|nr:bifunctional glutamate N-acetyltransferase/amino-acid acetyltransferase ArgJ [Planctomycetaceae bacterium]